MTRIGKETRDTLCAMYKAIANDYRHQNKAVREYGYHTTPEAISMQKTAVFRFGKVEGLEMFADRMGYKFVTTDYDEGNMEVMVKSVKLVPKY